MAAIERVIPLVNQLPVAIRAALVRRLRELAGLGLITLTAGAAAALMTWSVQDPSLSHATSRPIHNVVGYVGAAATKSVMLGVLILITARFFVPYHIEHPVWMAAFLVLTAVSFSLFGFIVGLWADDFQKLQVIPLMIMTPLTFLGGAFYSISMLPPIWQKITLFNPVVYLISGFRWSFFDVADVAVGISLSMTLVFLVLCLVAVWWIFRTGYKLKS